MLRLLLPLLFLAAVARAGEPEAVSVPAPDGLTLEAYFFAAEGEGRRPAMVMMHGCSGLWTKAGKMTAGQRGWAERFARAGIHALVVDSFRPRGIDEVCGKAVRPITAVGDRPYDAYAALALLKTRPAVDPARIGVIGWSHGGSAALATVAASREERGFRLGIAFYPGCTLERAFRNTVWTAQVPTLILAGEADDWTPASHCRTLVAAAEGRGAPVSLTVYPGAHHAFDAPAGKVQAREVRGAGSAEPRTVHYGPDPAAREASILAVTAFLEARLRSD